MLCFLLALRRNGTPTRHLVCVDVPAVVQCKTQVGSIVRALQSYKNSQNPKQNWIEFFGNCFNFVKPLRRPTNTRQGLTVSIGQFDSLVEL